MNACNDTFYFYPEQKKVPSKLIYTVSFFTSSAYVLNFLFYKDSDFYLYFSLSMLFFFMLSMIRIIDSYKYIDVPFLGKVFFITMFTAIAAIYYYIFINDLAVYNFFKIYFGISVVSLVVSLFKIFK